MGIGGSSDSGFYSKDIAKAALSKNKGAKHHRDSILEAFQEWDTNNDGFIDKDELCELMQSLDNHLTESQVESLIKAADRDGDDKMDYKEMVEWIFRSPHIERYFDTIIELQKQIDKEVKKLFASKKPTQAAWGKLQRKMQEKCDSKLTPLVRGSFSWHDKLENGYLEEVESIEFFSNYVEQMLKSKEPILYLNVFFSISEIPEEYGLNMQKVQELIDAMGPGMLEAFQEEQEQCCTAAFELLDVDNNQRLQLAEITEGLLPGHDRHKKMLAALKVYVSPEDAAAAANAAAAAAEGSQAVGETAEVPAAATAPADDAPAAPAEAAAAPEAGAAEAPAE